MGGEDHEDTPHIPEPDYDVSDVDNNSYSGSESSWKDTATLRRNQRNERERKKKKTVSFIMNEELANIIHSSGTMTKKDSILKDPSREKDPVEEPRGRWRTAKRGSPTKVAPVPMPETPKTPSEPTFNSFFASPDAQKRGQVQQQQQNGAKNGVVQGPAVHPAWEGGSIVEPGAPAPEPASKLVSTSKIRIEVGSGGQQGTGAKSVHRSNSLQRPSSQHLQKSQSFSSPPSIQKPLFLTPNKMQDAATASGAISQSELQRAKMQLKSSRSYPELLEDGDNSSSGVSSDQDQDSVTMQANGDFVTQLTVSNGVEPRAWGRLKSQDNYDCESNSSGTGSSHSEDLSDKTWILQSESYGPGSQNMVSMQQQAEEKIKGSAGRGGKTKALSGVVPGRLQEPVQIEWSQPSEEQGQEHHYQNFHAMMKSHKSQQAGGAGAARYDVDITCIQQSLS